MSGTSGCRPTGRSPRPSCHTETSAVRGRVIFVNVLPPSREMWMAAGHAPLSSTCVWRKISHVPAMTTFGSFGNLQAGAAGVLVHEQRLLPRLPAVLRAEHAALALRTGGTAEGARHDDVLIRRMDDDRADAPRFREPHLRPRLAGVGGLVDPVPHHVHVANGPGLAGAGPDDVVIRGATASAPIACEAPCRRSAPRGATVVDSTPPDAAPA